MYNKRELKRDNRGSAMVTAIVVIAFISIMATVMLYASGQNYYMKSTDRDNRKYFYEAETGMEEVKSLLISEVNDVFRNSYRDTMYSYALLQNGEERQAFFGTKFFDGLKANWDSHKAGGTSITTYINSKLPTPYAGKITVAGTGDLQIDKENGKAYLRGVSLAYETTTDNGIPFYTEITTDFMIVIPDLEWGVNSSASTIPSGEEGPSTDVKDFSIADAVKYCNWIKK